MEPAEEESILPPDLPTPKFFYTLELKNKP